MTSPPGATRAISEAQVVARDRTAPRAGTGRRRRAGAAAGYVEPRRVRGRVHRVWDELPGPETAVFGRCAGCTHAKVPYETDSLWRTLRAWVGAPTETPTSRVGSSTCTRRARPLSPTMDRGGT